MEQDVLNMLETMASMGTAPVDGCSLFSVGYDDAYNRIKETYFERLFARGGSAEKYVIGPFGSGKTHFLRHLSEVARDLGCVTVEITLNKDIDFAQSLIVYKEMAREIRCPGSKEHGMRNLITSCLDNLHRPAPDQATADLIVGGWISGLDKADFKLDTFTRVAKIAFQAHIDHNDELFDSACRWLSGEIDDRDLAKGLGISAITRSEHNIFARRITLSLFQLIRHAGFKGTVVCFDEAEQGLTVDKKKTEKILSKLMANINALMGLNKGSALVVYALTPDLLAKMETFAALQQRVSDPAANMGFFDGNTRAPLIDLTRRQDAVQELKAIGESLVNLAYTAVGKDISVSKEDVLKKVGEIAEEISLNDISSSNRRTMVKNICSLLLRIYDTGELEVAAGSSMNDEDEV